MRKPLFIVNPAAGHGRGERRWRAVAARIIERTPDCEVLRTSAPGEAEGLTIAGMKRGFQAIIAVGGDGTLGEVVNGFLSADEPLRRGVSLGTWPVGSGCDFARHIGMGRGESDLLSLLAKPRLRRLDAGEIEYADYQERQVKRYFLNIAAVGLAGEIALRVHKRGKLWGGTLSYFLHSLAALFSAKAQTLDLMIDGQAESGRYHLIALANTSTSGGGMKLVPGADPEDGKVEVLTVGDLSRLELLCRFPLIYFGRHIGTPQVTCRQARRVEIRSREKVYLNIDGEAIGVLPLDFRVLPGAVSFLCPT